MSHQLQHWVMRFCIRQTTFTDSEKSVLSFFSQLFFLFDKIINKAVNVMSEFFGNLMPYGSYLINNGVFSHSSVLQKFEGGQQVRNINAKFHIHLSDPVKFVEIHDISAIPA